MNPFPLVLPCFYNPHSLYPFICIRMAFLSCLSRLAKLLLGTLSLHLPKHLPLDSYESCANKHLFCGVLLHHFSNLSHRSLKSEDASHQSLCMCFTFATIDDVLNSTLGPSSWSHVCCSESCFSELCNMTPIPFSAHLSKFPLWLPSSIPSGHSSLLRATTVLAPRC